jgi:hypothetical protein
MGPVGSGLIVVYSPSYGATTDAVRVVCELRVWQRPSPDADRDLIVAAPELLAALKELIDQLEGIGVPDWHGAEGLSLEQARGAINKAEGRVE